MDDYITGAADPPAKTIIDKDTVKPNPEYTAWYRQDQVIFSAILDSCSDAIQPIIASASTAKEAWNHLNTSYTSTSRSRIISLKSKLAKNPRGIRPINKFFNEMRSISDELALAESPIHDDDLLVHILSQLGDEYNSIAAGIKILENPITFPELFDKLVDFKRALKESKPTTAPMIVTANYSQRQPHRNKNRSSSDHSNRGNRSLGSNMHNINKKNRFTRSRTNKSHLFCQYYNILG